MTGTTELGRCGSYELLVELASGGMASVYLARAADGRDAPLVAIKRPHRHLAKDKLFLTMLVDEARLASSIKHDNVVRVRELGFDTGEPFIVMDYVEGASVADVRKELKAAGRALDPRVAIRIALDALAGLEAAHVLTDHNGRHLGIIHRDVSPHNVLIGCDGVARLTDFGIAKAQDRVQETRTHEVKGKLAYLAPERIDKRRMCTVQSDVFSMAVVLWECIAGRRLFRGEEAVETLQEVMTAPIPSLRKIGAPVSATLDDAILRGLSRDLDERYATAADFANALREAAGREGIAAPAEVAALVEALFGDRLRVRHEKIREVLDAEEVAKVFEVSGLSPRPAASPEMRERSRFELENLAPPAPGDRYAFGGPPRIYGIFAGPRIRLVAAAVIGLALAAVVIAVVVKLRAPSRAAVTIAEPAVRRVVVPLPFLATRVTFDDESRELSPPVDVVAFEVPREAGLRHRIMAVAVDGARAEAYVREEDGVARPEDPAGFAIEPFEAYEDEPSAPPTVTKRGSPSKPRKVRHVRPRTPPPPPPPPPATAAASAPKPVATVKDGFTKLQ